MDDNALVGTIPNVKLEQTDDASMASRMQQLYGEATLEVLLNRAHTAQELLEDWTVEVDTLLRVMAIQQRITGAGREAQSRQLFEMLQAQKLLWLNEENHLPQPDDYREFVQRLSQQNGNEYSVREDAVDNVLFLRDAGVLSLSRKHKKAYQDYVQERNNFSETTDRYIERLKHYAGALRFQMASQEDMLGMHSENESTEEGEAAKAVQETYDLPVQVHALAAYIRKVESYRNGEMEVPQLALPREHFAAMRAYDGTLVEFPVHPLAERDGQMLPSLPHNPRTVKYDANGNPVPHSTAMITTGPKTESSARRSYHKRMQIKHDPHLTPYAVPDLARVVLLVERRDDIAHAVALFQRKVMEAYAQERGILPMHYDEDFKSGGMPNFDLKLPLNGITVELKLMERGQFEAYLITHEIYEIQRRMEVDGTMVFREIKAEDERLYQQAEETLGRDSLQRLISHGDPQRKEIRKLVAEELAQAYEADRQLMQAEYRHILFEIEAYHKAARMLLQQQDTFKDFAFVDAKGYGAEKGFDKEHYAKRYDELKAIHQAIHVSYMLCPDELHKTFGEGVMIRDSETGKLPVHEAGLAWRLDYADKILALNESYRCNQPFRLPFPEHYLDHILSLSERRGLETLRMRSPLPYPTAA